jgi:hypothetical protein
VRSEVQTEFNAWVRSASATSVWETGCHRHRVRRFDLSQYAVMPEHVPAPAPVAGA